MYFVSSTTFPQWPDLTPDPSLAVLLPGFSTEALMQDWQTFELVFENLCMRDLDIYARALPDAGVHPLCYYRDDSALEIDAIIDRADHSWEGIEIKFSPGKIDDAAASLSRMCYKLSRDSEALTSKPFFMAALTGTGERAHRRLDGIYVIPIHAFGAQGSTTG